MIICIHYKVGYSSLMAILVNNSVDKALPTHTRLDSLTPEYVKRLVQYSPEEIKYRLENYYKFMFVRHPFDRILSAWRDKLFLEMQDRHGNYYKYLLPKILHLIHPDWLKDRKLRNIRIPFPDVIHWLHKGGWDMPFQGPY